MTVPRQDREISSLCGEENDGGDAELSTQGEEGIGKKMKSSTREKSIWIHDLEFLTDNYYVIWRVVDHMFLNFRRQIQFWFFNMITIRRSDIEINFSSDTDNFSILSKYYTILRSIGTDFCIRFFHEILTSINSVTLQCQTARPSFYKLVKNSSTSKYIFRY